MVGLGIGDSMGVITRHVVYALLLWCFEDSTWQVNCESNKKEEGVVTEVVASEPAQVKVEIEVNASSLAPPISALEPTDDPNFRQIIHIAPYALTPDQLGRLNSPGAVDTSNFKTPTAVYVAVPIVALTVGFCSIWAYCSWKKNLRKNRNAKIEKVAQKHRRASMKPGSAAAKDMAKQAAKWGLSERTGKTEHDPAALITFSAGITGLAVELETVEQTVLDYKSYNAGEAIPEFHKLAVEGQDFSVTINPLYNSLQSGACGYVLSGMKTPFIRHTDGRRTSVPFMLESSLYLAPPPPPPPPPPEDESTGEEDDDEDDDDDDDDEDDHEIGSSSGTTEATEATESPSSAAGQASSSKKS